MHTHCDMHAFKHHPRRRGSTRAETRTNTHHMCIYRCMPCTVDYNMQENEGDPHPTNRNTKKNTRRKTMPHGFRRRHPRMQRQTHTASGDIRTPHAQRSRQCTRRQTLHARNCKVRQNALPKERWRHRPTRCRCFRAAPPDQTCQNMTWPTRAHAHLANANAPRAATE